VTRIVALTGNAASGKSTVAALFQRWGATRIDADALVRELQRAGTGVHDAIVAAFGDDIVAPDGELDRARLRARVLHDAAARQRLEAIVHPAVARRRDALTAAAVARGDALVIVEIPLLFEADDPARYDAVIVVDAPEPVRRERLRRTRHLDDDTIDRLFAAQIPSERSRARADFVIDNDGSPADLERRARVVWDALQP
jgi:dephospho-CoA kinase